MPRCLRLEVLLLERRRRGDIQTLEIGCPVRQRRRACEVRRRRMLGGEAQGFVLRWGMASLEGLEFGVYCAGMLAVG